jgi:hypothetical protein
MSEFPSGSDMSIVIGGRSYDIVPSKHSALPSRAARSKIRSFGHADLQGFTKFQYDLLPNVNKNIPLLRLRNGFLNNEDIEIELFDVEFSDDKTLPVHLKNKSAEQKYEAVSWCWGSGPKEDAIMVTKGEKTYKMAVSHELALALKYLRKRHEPRVLWIDAICIDQENIKERNHQVQMMSLIYTRATQVCVWLGEDTDESNTAIRFIRDEIMHLENFDSICSNKANAMKWRSLLMLMQRDWFSRRWVVQEVALARDATVYCGPECLSWRNFAVAVELFVEVETATHRLSEVMQKDERFYHVPGWFEYVSELGASLLISATGKVFRRSQHNINAEYEGTDGEYAANRRLQSLEFLVSSLFTFEASVPHDVIYSLLAIARDTAPYAEEIIMDSDSGSLIKNFGTLLERKPYVVDYSRPFPDVCKEFVIFCIAQAKKSDPSRALDILCRPWAPSLKLRDLKDTPSATSSATSNNNTSGVNEAVKDLPLPSWIGRIDDAPYALFRNPGIMEVRKMGRKNADPLVGLSEDGHKNYSTSQGRMDDLTSLRFVTRPKAGYYSLFAKGFVLAKIIKVGPPSQNGAIPRAWFESDLGGWKEALAPNSNLQDPPDDFWRTLVADRGRDNRNPPYYYAKACLESVAKGGLESGAVSTTELIHNERNSIINEFCRRVQAVIWNRRLVKVELKRDGDSGENAEKEPVTALGLVASHASEGDLVCILYGCSVPVVLKKSERKKEETKKAEREEDAVEVIRRFRRRAKEERERRSSYRKRKWEDEATRWPDNERDQIRKTTEIAKEDLRRWKEDIKTQKESKRKAKDASEAKTKAAMQEIAKIFPEPRVDPTAKSKKERAEQVRREDSFYSYEMRGECYIHGMMDGAAMQRQFYEGLPERVFEIR